MARNSGWQREEYESLRTMAKGTNTVLEGLLSLDNIVHRQKAQAVVEHKAFRKKLALENWQNQFDLSLKTMLKLLNVFSDMNRHPQFSPLKKQISDLLAKD